MATFGVTSAEVAEASYGLAITASTVPSTTTVTSLITEAGARISAVIFAKGLDPGSLVAADEPYQLGRAFVRKWSAYETMLAAQHRMDVAGQYRTDCDQLLDEIRASAANLGSARATGEGSPDVPRFWTEAQDDTETQILESGNLRALMRWRREL